MRALRKKLDLEAAERRKREEMSKNRDRAKAGDSMGELSSTFACAAKKVFVQLVNEARDEKSPHQKLSVH